MPNRESPLHVRDDRVLALLMIGVSVPRLFLAIASNEKFGAQTTVAALFNVLGVLLLLTARRGRRD